MEKSKILQFLTGYEKSEATFDESRKNGAVGRTFYSLTFGGARREFLRRLASGRLSKGLSRFFRRFAYTSTRSYGFLLLTFGLMTLLAYLGKYYFLPDATDTSLPSIIAGTVCTLIAVPMMAVDHPICLALQNFPITDFLLFEFFGIARMHRTSGNAVIHPLVTTMIGAALAIGGFFTSAPLMIGSAATLLFLALAIVSPEFPFLLTLLLFPFLGSVPHHSIVLCGLVGITFFSYMRKVILGKRVCSFEQYDLLLCLFALFILISGIFNSGIASFWNSVVILILTLGYIPASNLLVNRRLADHAIVAIQFSSLPVAIFGIAEYFLGLADFNWLDERYVGVIDGRITSTFQNPNVLAVFLIISTVLSLTFGLGQNRVRRRIFSCLLFLLNMTAMVLTWTRGAWVALLLGLGIYFALRVRRRPGILLLLLMLIPAALCFLPEPVLIRLGSLFDAADSSVSYRLSIWRSSLSMFRHNLFTGVGVGGTAFADAFASYAESGVTASHSHNLFLEIGCEAGIFALLVFLAVFLARARHISSYMGYVRRSSVHSILITSTVAVFCLAIYGMTDYIWSDISFYYLFWVIFAIGSACLRIAKRESDERLGYYGDDISHDASVADIPIHQPEKDTYFFSSGEQ